MRPLAILLLLISAAAPAAAQEPGLTSEWDIRQTLEGMAEQARKVKPVLDEVAPKSWLEKGAPDGYIAQFKQVQDELGYFTDTSQALARQPERLTLALEAYFRLQSLESKLGSLAEGVRRYQNAALGDLLMGVVNENAANRAKLRQYITDLAAMKEEEFKVADREAQRCRGVLSRQPQQRPPAAKKPPEQKP